MEYVEPLAPLYGGEYSTTGIVTLSVGIALLVLANAFAYALVKAFGIQSYYGRLLGGIVLLVLSMLLTLSTNSINKFRGAFTFAIGEIIIGGLDVINDKSGWSQPVVSPTVGCQGGA
ncbi:hypothetical protein [Acidianus bottle-shaped virus]|uniref:Putative transmembrane protein ORF116 n=1 Tax=Acidianus bottle-shaped virus (isolate Italy/Pozzuoli) TaxID=654911 RepID=Y116_ABVP|nr:hypothetical protein ABV_gp28 [Acidianus bottle-shaped virus]A4ZUB4.1 RecName: Full=Putative transmembrane protein ORF116 [Acidianus bottle-shaped virus (isolate Pozzuoli)]ABP73418.1 hypothetical protein [Acidianus bottle-shaped virus]